MAIAFARVSTISRGTGRSATAAAAYRSGVRIEDERTGEIFDYTRRTGVVHTEIVTSADVPAWAQDRAALWNAAEQSEKRGNARLVREIILALPHELEAEQRTATAIDMARFIADRHGVAVDVSVHTPDREGSNQNHHAHLLVSTRRLEQNGFTKKARELDDRQKGPQEIEAWRTQWEQIVNRSLERAGHDERIDMRSYDRQGKDREGQRHLGPKATERERKTGEKSYAGQYNDAVRQRNQSREANEHQAEVINLQIERERRRQRQDAIELWANQLRARTQSRQHDELMAMDREHGRQSGQKEDQLRQYYGSRQEAIERDLAAITSRQQRGGFFYWLTGKAKADREALPGLRLSAEDSRQREEEARAVYQNQQAHERVHLQREHERQRTVNEQRITQAFEIGQTPDQDRRRPITRERETVRSWQRTRERGGGRSLGRER